jgi:alkyl sulfatase BDS1-like metallo-beta-lactamase superfamily hydrolase
VPIRLRVLVLASALLAAGCEPSTTPPRATDGEVDVPATGEADVHPVLAAHTAEFERRVHPVTDRVHVAVGFGLANSILVDGEDCAFVVDTMASVETAKEVRSAFAEITQKPIRALVYTHNHADHVFGGPGFARPGDVEVYAHATTEAYIDRVVNVIRPIVGRRSDRMFGTYLPHEGPDRIVHAGIGPFLEAGHGGGTPGLIRPTITFEERLATKICGVPVVMVHAPGETNDQIFLWLPDEQTLLPGDNVYKAFPNLYTIRGTLYRDLLEWVRSLDAMRALAPEHLVPSHTRPVSGREEIAGILTAYRDAIQYVHDQTIRGMNRGLGPDELVEVVRLPPHLREHPWLRELYGTVEWSVRSVFSGYLGWFDGDTASLSPAPPEVRAARYVALAGGTGAMLEAIRGALSDREYAWAAELATHLIRAEPDLDEATLLKAAALRALGRRSISPNGRNFYLTQALELDGSVEIVDRRVDEGLRDFVRSIPIRNFMAAMPANLDPEQAATVDEVMGFRFSDVGESFALHVRRGVAEFSDGFPEDPDLAIRADSMAWIEVVAGLRGLPAAMASGDVSVEGGVTQIPAVLRFLARFR